MVLRYDSYDKLDMTEELFFVEECDFAEVMVEQKDKRCLFVLGMLFANGVPIRVLNEEKFKFENVNKSFEIMTYVWSNIGKPGECKIHQKTRRLDMIIDELKKRGVRLPKIINNPIGNKTFVICPVRHAAEEQKAWIEGFVAMKREKGYIVHYPEKNTVQEDTLGGYNICLQNALAMATSESIDIYYDQSSTGSVFDLGVAYALHKKLNLLNGEEIIYRDDDFIDQLVRSWPYNEKEKVYTNQSLDSKNA